MCELCKGIIGTDGPQGSKGNQVSMVTFKMLFNACNIFMCHWHYDMYYKYSVQISVCVSDCTSLLFRVQLERLGHRVNREIQEQRYRTNPTLHQMKRLYFELQICSCYLTFLAFVIHWNPFEKATENS